MSIKNATAACHATAWGCSSVKISNVTVNFSQCTHSTRQKSINMPSNLYKFYAHTCSRPFGSQNIWHNNKSSSCKRHKKLSTLCLLPAPIARQTTLSSCNFLIAITFFMLSCCCWLLFCSDEGKAKWNLLLHLLRILRHSPCRCRWRCQQIKNHRARASSTLSAWFLQLLLPPLLIRIRCMDIFRWPANSSSYNSNTTCNKWKLKENKSNESYSRAHTAVRYPSPSVNTVENVERSNYVLLERLYAICGIYSFCIICFDSITSLMDICDTRPKLHNRL